MNITLNFSEAVTLTGTLNVTLDTGAVVSFATQSGTSLSGAYIVVAGQGSSDLNVTAITLNGGSSLRDAATNASVLSAPQSNLADNKAIVIAAATPTVTSLIVNNGDVQRSRVTSIVVNFSSPVDVATLTPITLTRIGISNSGQDTLGTIINTSNGLQIAPATGTVSTITLTFANIATSGIDRNSLADGKWQLSLSPNSPIQRLTGDADNNGTVDGADLVMFGNAFSSSGTNIAFDLDNNGTVNGADLVLFGNHFGVTL